jgi:hypothetical protein
LIRQIGRLAAATARPAGGAIRGEATFRCESDSQGLEQDLTSRAAA